MKKKILYVHHSGVMGGAPRSLAFLVNELDFNQFDPVIWMMRDGKARKLFEETNAKVICNKKKIVQPFNGTTVSGINLKTAVKNFLGFIPTYFYAKKLIKEVNPDIIHLSTTCLFAFAKAAKVVNKDIKVICHVREPLLNNFFGKLLLYGNINHVDKFIAISKNDAKPFLEKKKNTSIIYNFVNIDDYKFDVTIRNEYRKRLDIKENNTLVISFFARVCESNGVLELLSVARKTNNNIKFFVFGFKGETEYEKRVEELKPDNVILMPMTNNVKEFMMATDLVISPFTQPHFSRSIVEASSMGIPSIVSNIGSQNELLIDKETGFLYETNDEAVSLIENIYNNRELLNVMGQKARAFAEQHFSAKKNAKLTFQNYD
jgi:glycosyltransferase involved in cell wall biosynthesis